MSKAQPKHYSFTHPQPSLVPLPGAYPNRVQMLGCNNIFRARIDALLLGGIIDFIKWLVEKGAGGK